MALKVTGLPVNPADVAVSVLGPTVEPSVQDVAAAIPLASVVTGVVGLTVPAPVATANVTETPATGLLN
jgi:acyl-CoA synthetase (NDP forming)